MMKKPRYAVFAAFLFVFMLAFRILREGMSLRAVFFASLTAVLATGLLALMNKVRRPKTQ